MLSTTLLGCSMLNLCPGYELHGVPATAGPPPSVCLTQIRKALSKMKCRNIAVPCGIVAEILKAAGEERVELARQLTEAVLSCSVTPSDWQESFILNLYKGKGEAFDRSNHLGLKLTDQVMKLLEWTRLLHLRDGEHR